MGGWRRWVIAAMAGLLIALAALPTPAAEATTDDLEALVATIEDEGKRAELVAAIRALIMARAGPAEEAPPQSPGARFIALLTDKARDTANELAAAAEALRDLPVVAAWLTRQVSEPAERARWIELLLKLGIVLVVGWIAEAVSRRLLATPRRALESRSVDSLVVRLPFLLARTVLDVAPIALFAAAAYAVLPVVQPGPTVQVVAVTVINAYLLARAVLAVSRMLLVPAAPSLRVTPFDDESAHYLFLWVRRLVWVWVVGYFAAEAAAVLGLPEGGHLGLLRVLGLLITAMLVVFVLQNRATVAAWIRGAPDAESRPVGGRLRQRFADIWHVLAILYVVAGFLIWIIGVEGGFTFLLRATLLTAAILVTAGLVSAGMRRMVARGFEVGDDVKARFPGLEARANRYLPVVHVVLRTLVIVIAAFAVLQAWGIDAFGWLETPLGQRVVQGVVSIGAVVVVSLMVWESVNAAVERYLNETDPDGKLVERSARARTLLPLMRNALMVVLLVLITLIVLSELGVNIGPLLAGAGVVGLAIGFGSQKLVQDVITGAFILFEDAISVGDVVKVSGLAGLVEAISIRSIRLRDLSGNVHTIPFSSVDTVTNMTKEFSYYVFDVGVAYREDTDQVTEVLRAISDEMQADREYGPAILEPLEVLGVDQFADSAVVIKVRIKTKPIKQWFVGREFNRRMKKRFDELGIEIPFPHTTVYFGVDKDGSAPPAYVSMREGDDGERRPAPKAANPRADRPGLPTEHEAGTDSD